MGDTIILTPYQIKDLEIELEGTEIELEKARLEMKKYKESEEIKCGCDDYDVLDSSYYENIATLVTRRANIEYLLSNSEVACPTGNRIQIGSIVELADRNKRFMLVQEKVTKNASVKEVSMDSPIFGAIYSHKTGDICEYTVNGRNLKCVIGEVDNETCRRKAEEMSSSNSLDHGAKVK